MLSRSLVFIAMACTLLTLGCGTREQVDDLAARLADTQKRIESLATENRSLAAEIEALKAIRPSAVTNAAPMDEGAASQFMSALASNINTLVAAQIDARIGTPDDIDAIMAETVKDELAAAEARKEAEQQARREEWRQEAEKRRKEWEQGQAATLAAELELNADQQRRIEAANEQMRTQFRDAMQAIRSGGDWTTIGGTMAEIRQANNDRMREIMTDDQYAAYTNRQANQVRSVMDLFSGAMRGRPRERTE